LVTVADVARLLPRHWDGQRLLRFLFGLAMLALAFAAHAGLTGTALSTPSAPDTTVTTTVDVPAVDPAPATADVQAPADVPAPALAAVTGVPAPALAAVADVPGSAEVVLASSTPASHGSRAPPVA
jgi:hypothetical protein